jgi:hypothetical protein
MKEQKGRESGRDFVYEYELGWNEKGRDEATNCKVQ